VSTPLAPIDDQEALPAPIELSPWTFLAALPAALATDGDTVAAFRTALAAGDVSLKARFAEDEPVEGLVRDRARMVDIVLRGAWRLHVGPHAGEVNLIAVGGYGRGELHPCSDIDVLILLPKSEVAEAEAGIERFLTFLWDIGLEVGHSVRTIDDCQRIGGVLVTKLPGDADLVVEQQPVLAPPCDRVQRKSHFPQECLRLAQLAQFGRGQEAVGDQLVERLGAEVPLGHPAYGLDVAQPAGARLDVGFEVVAGVVIAVMPRLLLRHLGFEKRA